MRVSLSVLLASALCGSASGNAFLMKTEDLDTSLEDELHARGDKRERVQEFKQTLLPYFMALPKNEAGNLEHPTARYILHRLFVHRHGWYIKGLEPNGDTFQAAPIGTHTFQQWVPGYLIKHLEKMSGHRGLDLNDLAVLGAALEDLIQQEARDFMTRIYENLNLNATKRSRRSVDEAVRLYAVSFLGSHVWDAWEAKLKMDWFIDGDRTWNESEAWYEGIEQEYFDAAGDEGGDIAMAQKIALDIGSQFGAFNDKQCKDMKASILRVWSKGKTTGRIRLADFYRVGLDSQWVFDEKKEYLRSLGALDESNSSSPLVIIPNYLTARPNCLDATSLYEVCCRNECEDLLGHLERSIAAPSATPDRIVELVSALGSDTVEAPRKLDSTLVMRLREIAERHGGEVKLHGRLFAQWMHHAYPSECPYPHEAGTSDPTSPDEWMGSETDVGVSEEERRAIVAETCGPEEAAGEWSGELPWSHTEELLPHHVPAKAAGRSRAKLALLALLVLAAIVAARFPEKVAEMNISGKQVLLAVLALVAVAANLVNPVLLIVMFCLGMLLQHVLAAGESASKVAHKLQKSLV